MHTVLPAISVHTVLPEIYVHIILPEMSVHIDLPETLGGLEEGAGLSKHLAFNGVHQVLLT